MKPIVLIPNNVLSEKAKPVTVFDRKLQNLIREMGQTLIHADNPKGVGLAAPQIGISLRVFVMKASDTSPLRAFINPAITKSGPLPDQRKPKRDEKLEGCLSVPKVWGYVRRSAILSLRYQDEKGQSHTEDLNGFPAVIVQHEVDHLDGILFTQRVLEQRGRLYEPGRDKHGKEILEEIDL